MENWMSKIPDDKKIILINIPGSHDSAAYNMFFLGSAFAKCQKLDISEQLRIGVRIFDIRLTLNKYYCCDKILEDIEKDTDIICCHGVCNCFHIENNKKKILTYKDILIQIREFLLEYPTETIILKTKSGRGNKYTNLKRSTEIFNKIIGGDISIEYNENLTLGEVRGKVVYTTFLSEKTSFDGVPLYNSKLDRSTTIYEIHRKLTNNNIKFNEYKVNGGLKVKEIKHLMKTYTLTFKEAEEELEKDYNNKINFPLNYETSCTGEFTRCKKLIPIPLPKYEANIVNNYLKNHNFKKGYYYGWISVDFIDIIITKKIIESNFLE